MVRWMAPLVIRQYDICKNPDRATRNRIPFFVVLQSDILSTLVTVIVAPLVPLASTVAIARLNPAIELQGKSYCITMQDLAGIPRKRLGAVVANVTERHTEFVAAVDLIFTGI